VNESAGQRSSSANDDSQSEIPDFELIRQIGQGGFGRVWMARNRTTGRLRAIKLIAKSRVGTADPAGREMASITRLEAHLRHHHPNLVTIHHVGQTGKHLFYVMDLADDLNSAAQSEPADYEPATLRHRLGKGPPTASECLAHARELLAGLASLHAAGMVHRDVKPANCLFIDGQLRLADFGLLTRTGLHVSRLGTEKYMPPDGRMDTRADIYAVGLVIYEMVTGFSADRFPQFGNCTGTVLADPTLSVLMRLALDACATDPQARFSDAGQMLCALESRLEQSPVATRIGRRRVIGLVGIAAIALVAFGAYWLFHVPRVSVNFITYPFDATILLDDEQLTDEKGDPLKTPCTADRLPARTHRVVFRLPGRPDLDAGKTDFSKTRQIVERWGANNPSSEK